MRGHPGAPGAGDDETAAQSALLLLTASMLRRRYGRSGLRGPGASFGPYPPEVPCRTLTCRGC